MANETLTRCGYRCDLCLAYKPNVAKELANRQIVSDGWFKYFGFRIPPELVVCDGCLEDNPKLIDQQCPIRPCVISRVLLHCWECENYGCDKLQERWVVYEEIVKKTVNRYPQKIGKDLLLLMKAKLAWINCGIYSLYLSIFTGIPPFRNCKVSTG